MAEYIKRDWLMKERHGCNRKCAECDFAQDGDSWCEGELFIVDVLRAPAADVVEVRHGSFLGTEFDGYADGNPVYFEWQCSVCGCIFEDEEPTYKYCPHCGAKMDGGQDDV